MNNYSSQVMQLALCTKRIYVFLGSAQVIALVTCQSCSGALTLARLSCWVGLTVIYLSDLSSQYWNIASSFALAVCPWSCTCHSCPCTFHSFGHLAPTSFIIRFSCWTGSSSDNDSDGGNCDGDSDGKGGGGGGFGATINETLMSTALPAASAAELLLLLLHFFLHFVLFLTKRCCRDVALWGVTR